MDHERVLFTLVLFCTPIALNLFMHVLMFHFCCWNVLVFTVTVHSAIALVAASHCLTAVSSLLGFTFSHSVLLAALFGFVVLIYLYSG